MSFMLLDVPHVSQNEIGGHTGHADHSEQNGCWYATTCMVSYFWEAGPRLGVPEQYARDPKDPEPMGRRYEKLKSNENYEGVPLPAAKKWTIHKLYNVLEYYGPCYVRRGFRNAQGQLRGGHAVALIGANIADNSVCLLDPWYPKPQEATGAAPNSWRQHHSIEDFNSMFKWNEHINGISLMYKKQDNAIAAASYIKEHQDLMWW